MASSYYKNLLKRVIFYYINLYVFFKFLFFIEIYGIINQKNTHHCLKEGVRYDKIQQTINVYVICCIYNIINLGGNI